MALAPELVVDSMPFCFLRLPTSSVRSIGVVHATPGSREDETMLMAVKDSRATLNIACREDHPPRDVATATAGVASTVSGIRNLEELSVED